MDEVMEVGAIETSRSRRGRCHHGCGLGLQGRGDGHRRGLRAHQPHHRALPQAHVLPPQRHLRLGDAHRVRHHLRGELEERAEMLRGEIARLERRLAVAEFRSDLYLDREAGDPLDQLFADQAGVGCGAAGGRVRPPR